MKFKYILFVFFSFNSFFSASLWAGNVASKAKELTVLQKKIKQISFKINALSEKKSSLLSRLKKLDMQYAQGASIVKDLESRIAVNNNVLEQNRDKIRVKKNNISSQKKSLAGQVKAAHGMGRNEKLKLILNQQDPALSGRVMVYYDYLNKVRAEKISAIESDLTQLKELEASQLEEQAALTKNLKQRQVERELLGQTKSQQKNLLSVIEKQFSTQEQKLNRYKSSEKRLKNLISRLQKAMDDFPLEEGVVKEFAKLKGALPWPLKGKIVKKFGAKRADSRWDGVLIKAKEGLEIKAVTRGRVVYADWLRGYGMLTIIDHGKGYMTLYAFNQSLYKTVGEWVEAGMVIASVGQSGGQLDTGLYFGIRQKGKPVNPVKWCRKVRHGTVM